MFDLTAELFYYFYIELGCFHPFKSPEIVPLGWFGVFVGALLCLITDKIFQKFYDGSVTKLHLIGEPKIVPCSLLSQDCHQQKPRHYCTTKTTANFTKLCSIGCDLNWRTSCSRKWGDCSLVMCGGLEEQNLISGSHFISTAQRFWRHKLFGSCGHKIVRDQVIKKSESCQKLCKGWSQLREQASIFSEKLQLSICTLPFRFAPCRTHCCEKVLILRNEVIGKLWTRTFQT